MNHKFQLSAKLKLLKDIGRSIKNLKKMDNWILDNFDLLYKDE